MSWSPTYTMSHSPYVAVVVADFYRDIADGLLASCNKTLKKEYPVVGEILIYRVAGALEIPPLLQHIAEVVSPLCMVALGCVIRGETYHFEVVSNTASAAIMQVQLKNGVPIGNGLLTVENREQAMARLDKGADAANAVMNLAKQMERW